MTQEKKYPLRDIEALEHECGEWDDYAPELIQGRIERLKAMCGIGDKGAYYMLWLSQQHHIQEARTWLSDIDIDL